MQDTATLPVHTTLLDESSSANKGHLLASCLLSALSLKLCAFLLTSLPCLPHVVILPCQRGIGKCRAVH